jgi:hypothetical protein
MEEYGTLIKVGSVVMLAGLAAGQVMRFRREPEQRRLMGSLLRDRNAWLWAAATAMVLEAFNIANGTPFSGLPSSLLIGLSAQLVLAWKHQRTHA